MKEALKSILPKALLRKTTGIRVKFRKYIDVRKLYYNDFKRYNNSAFLMNNKQTVDNLRARITLHYHSLEKGMSNSNLRIGFGKSALNDLFCSLEEYINCGFSLEDPRFKSGVSTIHKYIELHKLNNYNVLDIEERLLSLTSVKETNAGGVYEFKRDELLSFKNSNFHDLSKHRFSVRDFSDEEVDRSIIEDAIKISMKTPSVCNRQPWTVYLIQNPRLINEVLKIQGGLNGNGKKMDTLLLVTSDNSYLAGPEERNQGFVDGGMFSMSLLYALTHVGLATCTLNADFDEKRDTLIRQALEISETENLILFIAVGNYPDKFKVPKSQRDSYKNIVKYF